MTDTSTEKTFETMEDEVEAYCREKGWYDEDVPVKTALALLHEEVGEALHAWRITGLDDATAGSAYNPGGDPGAKPEGVGSELADVLIRLLDDSRRYGLGLPARVRRSPGLFALSGEFPPDMDTLHNMISRASMSWESGDDWASEMAGVLTFLGQAAGYYGIDLTAEYERKMAYNRTRAHRHGGRRA